MTQDTAGSKAVEAFIDSQPDETKQRLIAIRQAVAAAVPAATETISYGIPTFQMNGKNMLHYGPGKNHVGLYATPDGHAGFEAELSAYKRGKGSVQFPFDQPLPLDLITRIARFRAESLQAS